MMIAIVFVLQTSCSAHIPMGTSQTLQPTPLPTPFADPNNLFTDEEEITLNSLEQVDDHPLYTMRYSGPYPAQARSYGPADLSNPAVDSAQTNCRVTWGCSLFAALGDEEDRLFGRNFDWHFSPALLLFTDPPDGYASVSMVDIEYLGFEGDLSRKLTDLPLEERRALLDAPSLPFDGMNEKGLAVGMAAVPPGDMKFDPEKETVDELRVIREILDHAATVDEAITILGSYNIDMGNVPIHYLIAEGASPPGGSALVEFYRGEMVILRNDLPWQQATNFLVASMNGNPAGACQRYDLISERLGQEGGRINVQEALNLLADVSQEITQWSVVYNMTDGSVHVVMGRDYETVHTVRMKITRK